MAQQQLLKKFYASLPFIALAIVVSLGLSAIVGASASTPMLPTGFTLEPMLLAPKGGPYQVVFQAKKLDAPFGAMIRFMGESSPHLQKSVVQANKDGPGRKNEVQTKLEFTLRRDSKGQGFLQAYIPPGSYEDFVVVIDLNLGTAESDEQRDLLAMVEAKTILNKLFLFRLTGVNVPKSKGSTDRFRGPGRPM